MEVNIFLTIVDDFSRFTWIVTMKNKKEVAQIIPKFHAMVKNQFGNSIKVIRSDNGPKFDMTSFSLHHVASCIKSLV